jgi:uncharacterized membrane protein
MKRLFTLRAALIASLLVNALFIGLLTAAVARWQRIGVLGSGQAAGLARVQSAARDISPQYRGMYRRAIIAAFEEAAPDVAAAREAREDLAKVITAAKFDPVLAESALTRARDADMAVRARLELALITVSRSMPAAERQTLAKGLRRSGVLQRADSTRDIR